MIKSGIKDASRKEKKTTTGNKSPGVVGSDAPHGKEERAELKVNLPPRRKARLGGGRKAAPHLPTRTDVDYLSARGE